MPNRSLETAWKLALTAVTLIALATALYLQLFERRALREEERLAGLQQEALAAAQKPQGNEDIPQLRTDLVEGVAPEPQRDQPLPNAVLRRGESGTGSALQQFVGPPDTQQLLVQLQASVDALSRRMEESDRAQRRDLDAWRAQVRRELDAVNRVLTFLLVALVPLVAHFLVSVWKPMRWRRGEQKEGTGEGSASLGKP
jgi:hypothetical protein